MNELGGKCYNLACLYALIEVKEKVFGYLKIALEKKQRYFDYVEKDEYFKDLRNEPEYKKLKEKYSDG